MFGFCFGLDSEFVIVFSFGFFFFFFESRVLEIKGNSLKKK